MSNPANPVAALNYASFKQAAASAKLDFRMMSASTPEEVVTAIAEMTKESIGAFVLDRDSFLIQQREQVARLAANYRLPWIAGQAACVEAGALLGYGPSNALTYRRMATYVDKILKGAIPGDLPVEQPTKFELVINKKTAKTLGLTIPPELLLQADKVVE